MNKVDLSPAAVDAVIQKFIDLGAEIKALQEKRAALIAPFPQGRTEGAELAVYKSGAGWANVLSLRLLRKHASPLLLARCTQRKHKNGSARVVKKLKPRGKGL